MDGGSIEKLIQGAVEEYMVAAEGNVNIGEFVTFLSDYLAKENVTETTVTTNELSYLDFYAVALTENSVYIGWVEEVNYNKFLYSFIYKIENNTLVQVIKAQPTFYYNNTLMLPGIIKMSNKKLIIFGTINYIPTLHCVSIDNTNISLSKDTSSTGGYKLTVDIYQKTYCPILIDTNLILAGYFTNISNREYICFTAYSFTEDGKCQALASKNFQLDMGASLTLVNMAKNKALCFFIDSNLIRYGYIVVNDSNISYNISADNIITDTNSVTKVKSLMLNDSKVLLVYSTGDKLWTRTCEYDGNNNITNLSIPLLVDTDENIGRTLELTQLEDSKVLATYTSADYSIKTSVVSMNNTELTSSVPLMVYAKEGIGEIVSVSKINSSSVIISHSLNSNSGIGAFVLDYMLNQIKTVTKRTERIAGVALKKGTAGQTVPIAVPNYID